MDKFIEGQHVEVLGEVEGHCRVNFYELAERIICPSCSRHSDVRSRWWVLPHEKRCLNRIRKWPLGVVNTFIAREVPAAGSVKILAEICNHALLVSFLIPQCLDEFGITALIAARMQLLAHGTGLVPCKLFSERTEHAMGSIFMSAGSCVELQVTNLAKYSQTFCAAVVVERLIDRPIADKIIDTKISAASSLSLQEAGRKALQQIAKRTKARRK